MAIPIESLAFIGDRRTLAAVSKDGSVCWYCPGRFDKESLFASLLDEKKGGEWSIHWNNSPFTRRHYEEDSAILKSIYQQGNEVNVITDFMPAGQNSPKGICRMLEGSAASCTIQLKPAPDFSRQKAVLEKELNYIRINDQHFFYSSFPAQIVENRIEIQLDSLSKGWMFLSEE